ncbi:MAG: PDZ domain-containing protein [Acidobacteria bacterium]|nr:PDZ domain-containing protein [Acidobacteriota bacterium]
MRRTLWGIAVLAALAAPALAAGAEATTQEEREETERTVVRRFEIGGSRPEIGVSVREAEATTQEEREETERTVVRRFEIGGSRPEIGVSVRDVEEAAEGAEGAGVTGVRADGPAEAAGIEAGDVIVEFDGERVRGARQLARLVEETPAGRAAPVRVLRDGSPVALSVTPAESSGWAARVPRGFADRIRVEVDEFEDRRVEIEERARELAESESLAVLRGLPEVVRGFATRRPGRARLGIRADSVGGQLAEYFGTEAGILVEHVDDGTPGAAAGLRAGDVITAVDGQAVDDLGALRRQLARLEPDAAFDVTIVRDRAETSLTVEPPEDEEEEEEESPRPRRRGSAI